MKIKILSLSVFSLMWLIHSDAFATDISGGCVDADFKKAPCDTSGCVYDHFTKRTYSCKNDDKCDWTAYGRYIATAPGYKARCSGLGGNDYWGGPVTYKWYFIWAPDAHRGQSHGAWCSGFDGSLPGKNDAKNEGQAVWVADSDSQCWRWDCADPNNYALNSSTKKCEKITPAWCMADINRFHPDYKNFNLATHTITTMGTPSTCTYRCAETGYGFKDRFHSECILCTGNDRYKVSDTSDNNDRGVCIICKPTETVSRDGTKCVPAQEKNRAQISQCWKNVSNEPYGQDQLTGVIDQCISGYYTEGNPWYYAP